MTPRIATGSYAIQGGGQSWMSSPIVAATKSKAKKAKAPPPVIHPFFLDLQALSDDELWKSIFGSMAIGRFPKGYMFRDNSISFKRRTKTFRLDLDLTLPHSEIIQQIQNFYRNTSGLQSDGDMQKTQTVSQSVEDVDTWRHISRPQRMYLIRDYVRREAETRAQRDELLTMINLGVYLGYLNLDDFEYSDGQLQHVNGLVYRDQKYEFDSSRKPNPLKKIRAKEDSVGKPDVNFLDEWLKFLAYFDKIRK